MLARTTFLVPGFALALASLLQPQSARADTLPGEPDACAGKAKGDACPWGRGTGTCQPDKCSDLDYSKGTPPAVRETDCLKCGAAAATPAAVPTTPSTPPPAAAAVPSTPPPAAAAAPSAPAAPPVAPAPSPKKTGACTIAGDPGSLAVLLLLGIARRRRKT